jgi:regulatory protein
MDYDRAFKFAINSLSKRAQLCHDLKKKLFLKGCTEDVVEKVIGDCQRLNFLNDDSYIESFIRSQILKKMGPKMILIKLYRKGIPSDKAHHFLKSFDSKEKQEERLQNLIETKYQKKDLKDYKTREKTIAALMRKGFDLDLILSFLSSNNFKS